MQFATYAPARGAVPASLLLAHRPVGRVLVVVGAGKVAAARVAAAREAGMRAAVVWHGPRADAHAELRHGDVAWHAVSQDLLFPPAAGARACEDAWGALLDGLDGDACALFGVCIADTLLADTRGEAAVRDAALRRCAAVAAQTRRRRLPLNVVDRPQLCDFSFPAAHRFSCGDAGGAGRPSSLQIAVTTNGRGCRLAGRLRRQMIAALPATVGDAVERTGELRARAKRPADHVRGEDEPALADALGGGADVDGGAEPAERRRMRWVAQVSEYWPLERLATLSDAEMDELLRSPLPATDERRATAQSRHALALTSPPPHARGHMYLLGTGPGHPALLTVAARDILMSPRTDLILSDKLVPTAVLALVPANTPLVIAKKFPGNADGAQSELITQALEAACSGKTVVRLKQGDPFVYGRGGEELVACREAGVPCTVVPGISSALAGPLLMDIPVTQRGAADSLVLCTGVGRGGKRVELPGYERARTLLLLMGVARLAALVDTLRDPAHTPARRGAAYPGNLPIAIIERASSSDQRMIASTLDRIVDVLENHVPDGARPPSMMVVGWTVLSLAGPRAGNVWAAPGIIPEPAAQAVTGAVSTARRVASPDPSARGPTGWAPPRYGEENTLRGGWTPGEQQVPGDGEIPHAAIL
ncbi:uroporphyrinogen-III C-methyltransferase [Malassezia sp. CBS 17886]|nr:uroporphyrinogen-III C-methyltransferase [Malassezia sp. CBS 17886]